jgi:hypothetical protein
MSATRSDGAILVPNRDRRTRHSQLIRSKWTGPNRRYPLEFLVSPMGFEPMTY